MRKVIMLAILISLPSLIVAAALAIRRMPELGLVLMLAVGLGGLLAPPGWLKRRS